MADISNTKLKTEIKAILKGADLSTLSAKKVRLKLQGKFDKDLSQRKKEIDKMTMALIVDMEKEKEEPESEEEQTNGKDREQSEEEEEEAEEEEEKEPPKKKSKKSKKEKHVDPEDIDVENDSIMNIYDEEQKVLKMTDEELAIRLQTFEETGRRTRGSRAPPKKPRKKKEPGTSTYSKPCVLSAALAEVMGQEKLPRNEVVKKMWEIVKERKLEDPKDRRFMLCDDQLLKIFGKKRVQTFAMMKYLGSHIKDEDFTIKSVITNSDIYDDEADDD